VRLSDSFVIEKLASAMHLFDEDEDEGVDTIEQFANDKNQESTNGATHCSLCLNGNNVKVSWQSTTEKHLLTFDAKLARFIQYQYMSTNNVTTIHCCTEYIYNKVMMGCHPSYQGEGPWFDWVSVQFVACTFNEEEFP
jgi:ribosomal protein L31